VTAVFALTFGAVKSPELEIAPALADQVTAVLVEPVTVAVNCRVPPETAEPLVGDIETDTGFARTEIWKVWFRDPLQVFCAICAPGAVDAPTTAMQPLDMFPDRIL